MHKREFLKMLGLGAAAWGGLAGSAAAAQQKPIQGFEEEPVDPNAVEAFVAEASRFGFTPGGIFPAAGTSPSSLVGLPWSRSTSSTTRR